VKEEAWGIIFKVGIIFKLENSESRIKCPDEAEREVAGCVYLGPCYLEMTRGFSFSLFVEGKDLMELPTRLTHSSYIRINL
jgi:hypothetical protein